VYGAPVFAYASTIWQSAPIHPDEVRIYTPELAHSWFNGTLAAPVIQMGTWDQPDFTTTASTSVHLWARWNGGYLNILDVVLNATSGGDPFYGTGSTTAQVVTPFDDSYYRLNVGATSTLQEYTIPTRRGETIHQGNELWTFFYPSWATYGANHWLGSSGTLPYIEICEGPCGSDVPPPPPPPSGGGGGCDGCASNVLFLPGIEGSRLYRPDGSGEKKLWEPGLLDTLHDLYLTIDGKSARTDVYTKAGDIIDETPVTGANIYKSFIAKMDSLVTAGTINAWEADPYDWRLSIDDILTRGKQTSSNISYLDATNTPYIIQELKHLAATSKTGKVTVIAHSNGGLVAKQLTESLGADASTLIDKMIFVAVPQVGTPAAVAADQHGYGQAFGGGLVVSQSTARTFASTSLMAYNLLPSDKYFKQVDNPVISFDASLPDWIARYGATIHSKELLHTFLTDSYGRVDAQTGDVNQPIQLSGTLLSSAEALHADLDNWAPPAGVQLIQIAGWGVPTTVSGITYKKKDTVAHAEPDFTVDGDGTVTVPSALWTSTTTGAVDYWVDLRSYNRNHPVQSGFGLAKFDHGRILEPAELLNFLSDQIASTTKPLSDYIYLSTQAPSAPNLRLRYALHSPLTLNLYSNGRHTGVSTTTGQVEEQIPGTYYTEFGDTKYIFSDASDSAQIVMDGYASGTFTFNVDQYSGDTLTASTIFKDIPTTANTIVSLDVQSDISTLSPMNIDGNGDGTFEIAIDPKMNGIAIFPYRWDGFSQPINDTAHQVGQGMSVFKGGSTIPVKFQIKKQDGTPIQAPVAPVWLAPQKGSAMSASVDESVYSVSGTSGTVYKWDSVAQQYVYNWSTKGLATGFWYKVYAKLDDGKTYSVTVGLK